MYASETVLVFAFADYSANGSKAQFISFSQSMHGKKSEKNKEDTHYDRACPRIDITMTEKAIPESIDQIEKRIEFGKTLPESG